MVMVSLLVTLAEKITETVTDVPVDVEIADASVLVLQLPEHPEVYADMSETALVSAVVKVTVAVRLLVTDEPIEMPVLYEEHGEVHAPTATP